MEDTKPPCRSDLVLGAMPDGAKLDILLPVEVVVRMMREAVLMTEPMAGAAMNMFVDWLKERGTHVLSLRQAAYMWEDMPLMYCREMPKLALRWLRRGANEMARPPGALFSTWLAMVRVRWVS